RGELTYFQSSTLQLRIADSRAIERLAVHADIAGNVALVLVAPDGTAVNLGRTWSPVTFGIDTLSIESLDALRGHSAAGTWPQPIVERNRIAGSRMRSGGSLGSPEFEGDVADLVVTSGTSTRRWRGTFGQFAGGLSTPEAIGGATHAYATQLRNTADFRSNVG